MNKSKRKALNRHLPAPIAARKKQPKLTKTGTAKGNKKLMKKRQVANAAKQMFS